MNKLWFAFGSLFWLLLVIMESILLSASASTTHALEVASTTVSASTLAATPITLTLPVTETPMVTATATSVSSSPASPSISSQQQSISYEGRVALVGVIVALIVGLMQSAIGYKTIVEMKVARLQNVKPFVVLLPVGDRADSYTFLLENKGVGIALSVKAYLDAVGENLVMGQIDFVRPEEKREMIVDLAKFQKWHESVHHQILIFFQDIYGTEYRLTFSLKNSGTKQYNLPISESVTLENIEEVKKSRFFVRRNRR
jgi:hypothetical protein